MAAPPRYKSYTDSGTLDGVAAGTTTAGTGQLTRNIEPGSLSVYADVTANTNTLTISIKWQVSMDDSTYIDVTPLNNAANVVLATGTGSNVTGDKVYCAPEAVFGWKYARPAVVSAVAEGNAADTYSLTARWVQRSAF